MTRPFLWVEALLAIAATAKTLNPASVPHQELEAATIAVARSASSQALNSQWATSALAGRNANDTDKAALTCFQVAAPVLMPEGAVSGDHSIGKPLRKPLSSCQVLLMDYHFANSYGQPFVAKYEPPSCSFNRVVINFTVVAEGRQYDRLALMYLGDNEVWRTSTAEPTASPGVIWTYWKDLTSYLALWREPQTLIFDLGNTVNDVYTGILNATLTATFFNDDFGNLDPSVLPADTILPVTKHLGAGGGASAFNFPQDDASTNLTLPRNARRAVLAISANGQSNEEFWWGNVPESSAEVYGSGQNALPGLSSFREVRARIDGAIAGMAWPFPVIFTGGVSPPLHRPIVGLEAFDIREHEIDITPWLGYLSDGRPHNFSLEVVGVNDTGKPQFATPPSYWVLTGKIFLWLDADGHHVTTGAAPEVFISPLDYVVIQNVVQNVSVSYNQTVHRSIEVKSTVKTAEESTKRVWTQYFSMSNNGIIKDKSNYQSVTATYSGADQAQSWRGYGTPYFYTSYNYPLNMLSKSKSPDGPWDLSIDTKLYQRLDRTVTGLTALSNDLAPFLRTLPGRVSGSRLSTHRNGTAIFYQYDNGTRSGGYGTTVQHYKLGAMRQGQDLNGNRESGFHFVAEPLLYSRDVTAVNLTVVHDEECAYKYGCQAVREKTATHRPSEVSWKDSFAPVPGPMRSKGLNRFMKKKGSTTQAP